MKPILESDFRILLKAAIILTHKQDLDDDLSVEVAFNFWKYIDACRKKFPDLKNVRTDYPWMLESFST